MNYKYIVMLLLLTCMSTKLYAEFSPKGEFVIFPAYTGSQAHDAILSSTEAILADVCNKAGRLQSVESGYKKAAIEKSGGIDAEDMYRKAAVLINAGVYAVISSYNVKGDFFLKLKVVPLNDKYKKLQFEKTLVSRIPDNLPLKAAREFAVLLKGLSLTGTVLEVMDDGSAIIDSGQWHGLDAGSYSTASGILRVKDVSRFTSVVHGQKFTKGQVIEFSLYPQTDPYIKQINDLIRENTVRVYGTDEKFIKRGGGVKEAIRGTCIINQGASFCVPGYGSFLSVEYMGIEKARPDYSSIFFTGALTIVHLGLVPVLTDFKVNFFPWIEDSDRTDRMRRLNYFMWGTLPLTFTASFYSQLAYQYRDKKLLPPAFGNPDLSAAVVSVFIPGGGLFYKGYTLGGWGVYLGELSLAGFAVYSQDTGDRTILLCSLAAVKCAEIILSYALPVSYSFYKKEVSAGDIDFSVSMDRDAETGGEISASVSLRY